MLEGQKIGVVVPCHNEAALIGRVIETMPAYVDRIIVVDDHSTDRTSEIVQSYVDADPERVCLTVHKRNQGVGGAIATGYKNALRERIDVTAVMAGDAQMDPQDLMSVLLPVVHDECDYTKGNRLFTGDAWRIIPRVRYLGNSVISLLTKIASGYWHIADSQSGYTAINLRTLSTIDWDQMYKRYGQPNDLLVRLNIYNFRVQDVAVKPVYGIGEKSGLKPLRLIPRLSWLLTKLFFYRLVQKYVIRDFHPLLFFYGMALTLCPAGVALGFYLLCIRLLGYQVAGTSALFSAFMVITGLQFLFFAMWFDMDYNKSLRPRQHDAAALRAPEITAANAGAYSETNPLPGTLTPNT